jgi:hypothetical protein
MQSEGSMDNCPRCGIRLLPGALACVNCQLPLEQAPPSQPFALPAPADHPQWMPPPAYGPPAPSPYPYGPAQPYPPGYGGYPPPGAWGPPTSGQAITSLVLALLWLAGIGSTIAIVMGHLARRKIRAGRNSGGGLALAGLIVGYIGLAGAILSVVGVLLVVYNPSAGGFFVRDDLSGVASAEASYYADNNTYTVNTVELDDHRYVSFFGDKLAVGVTGSGGTAGFCIVGHGHRSAWYLYDSVSDGVSTNHYDSAEAAESDCPVAGITDYEPVS